MKSASRASIAALITLFASALPAQTPPPNLIVSVTGTPTGFSSPGNASCGGMTIPAVNDVVLSERLFVTLTSTPTPVPTQLTLRRVALAIGTQDCSSFVTVGGALVPINFSSPVFILLDSFAHPTDPHFGPPLAGPSVINTWAPTSLFLPAAALPLQLVLQAITEDTPGGSTLPIVSNPVEIKIIDPHTGFAPSVTDVTSPPAGCLAGGPSGPESGGTTITVIGTNFPVQSDWFNHPPAIEIGMIPATDVVIHSSTMITAKTPSVAPTTPLCPPATNAGPKEIRFQNSMDISPMGIPVVPTIKFTYCSGLQPAVASVAAPGLTPEGGALAIIGTNFLFGADVVLSSVASPGLTITLNPDDAMITGTGGPCPLNAPTTISLAAPPFCAGDVNVQVVNPDGVASGLGMFTVPTLDPVVTQWGPMAAVTGLAGGTSTYLAMTATGSTVNITGSQFIATTSPLFGASTVPQSPGMLFPTKVELTEQGGGAPIPFASATTTVSPTSIALTASIDNQPGPFRPKLGLKTLNVINPPCVSSGTNATTTILVRDPMPPTIGGFFPNVVAQSSGGVASTILINGSNFFSRHDPTTLPYSQSYTGTPSLGAIDVPAVSFGGTFSPYVEILSDTQLVAQIPPNLLSSAQITVYNPDGRSATSNGSLHLAPRLTDPTVLTASGQLANLDVVALTQIAIANPFAYLSEAIIFGPNPTANDDRLEDLANGGDPSVTSDPSAYDGVFLFNTRVSGMAGGGMRCFDFNSINVPATFVLPVPVPMTGPALVTPGLKRVIFKASSFDLNLVPPPTNTIYVDQSFPLVLRSHGDFTFGGMMDLSGDSLVNQGVAASPALKFQYRCEWQWPPAAGGIGGRGGTHFENPLPGGIATLPALALSLPQTGIGVTAAVLGGDDGHRPHERFPPLAFPVTGGTHGAGLAPIGLQGGGGGGGGLGSAGAPGQIGNTSSPAAGGATFGNFANLPAGTPGRPPNNHDEYIYGAALADFAGPLGSSSAFPHGFFTGGSGGGGGGGSHAIVMPCVAMGGRGGNGGGGVVMLSDGIFKLGPYGRIFADGEKGLLGLDAFPFVNGEPLFVLCAPGSGGGGSGGLIFIAAVSDVNLEDPMPVVGPGQHVISAAGGLGGAPTGAAAVTTANGGAGGGGRIRVAMSAVSSMVPLRVSQMGTLSSNGNIAPDLGPLITTGLLSYP